MTDSPTPPESRLRLASAPATPDAEAIAGAVRDAIRQAAGGLPARALRPAVAARLGLPPGAVPADAVTAALGLAIATGAVDEVEGRLVATAREERRAG